MKSLLSAAATLRSHTALKQFAGRLPSPSMPLPKRVPALSAPGISMPKAAFPRIGLSGLGLQRRTFYRAAAVATVTVGLVGTGVASAMFVDFLAERAAERSAQGHTGSVAPVSRATAAVEAAETEPVGATEIPASKIPAAPAPAPLTDAAPAPQAPETDVEPAGSAIASVETDVDIPGVATAGDASLAAKSAANDDEFADRTFTAAISRPARIVQPVDPAEAAAVAQPAPSEGTADSDAAPEQVALNDMSEDEVVETDVQSAQTDAADIEGEAEVAAAEAEPVEEESELAAAEAEPTQEEAEVAAAEPTRTAKVKEYVNLRSGPADESKVLMVVPASKQVQVVACDGWCEVIYDGTRGYIYKSFIE